MSKKLNLTGVAFGRLTVISEAQPRNGRSMWDCLCACGNKITVPGNSLTTGNTTSCGCYQRDVARDSLRIRSTKHGGCGTRLYSIWRAMKSRCGYAKDVEYKNYGARGISVCDDWEDDFIAFKNWSLENGYRDSLSIDRIDTDGNYEPSNCRWSDTKTQNRNKRNCVKAGGKTIAEWSEIYGISRATIEGRLKRGWNFERAVSEPVRHHKGSSSTPPEQSERTNK